MPIFSKIWHFILILYRFAAFSLILPWQGHDALRVLRNRTGCMKQISIMITSLLHKKGMPIVLLLGTLIGIRAGEYAFDYVFGNKDGVIVTPWIALGLYLIYGAIIVSTFIALLVFINPFKKGKELVILFVVLLGGLVGMEIVFRGLYYQNHGNYPLAMQEVFLTAYQQARRILPLPEILPKPRLAEELTHYINDPEQIEQLFDEFEAAGVAFGNTPYVRLVTEKARSIQRDEAQNLVNTPVHQSESAFLRSRIFDIWDPITLGRGNLQTPLSPKIQRFIARYAFKPVIATIDEHGDRLTLPPSNAEQIMLIIGDSVAFGALLSDAETIASQLQQRYPAYKFINASVGGAKAKDNLSRLRQRLEMYGKRVAGVIYVHCENDYSDKVTPDSIMMELSNLLEQYRIPYRAFVHQVYLERTMPDMVRDFRYESLNLAYDAKSRLLNLARNAHFDVIDFYDIVDAYRSEMGTPLAGFSLYVDHCHLSALGTKLIVERLSIPNVIPQ